MIGQPITKDGVPFTIGMTLWKRCIGDDDNGREFEWNPIEIKTSKKRSALLWRDLDNAGWIITKTVHDEIRMEGRISDLYSSKEAIFDAQIKELECELDARKALHRGVKCLTPRAALADLLQAGELIYELISDTCYDEPESNHIEQFRVALLAATETLK